MSLAALRKGLCICKASSSKDSASSTLIFTRGVSSSPYGRTHVWRRRPHKLPNPVVPEFPQRVILADGSTFVHWTTSPRAVLRMTRDTTNSPIWNPSMLSAGVEDLEDARSGRLGRFRRKFEDLDGSNIETEWVVEETQAADVKKS